MTSRQLNSRVESDQGEVGQGEVGWLYQRAVGLLREEFETTTYRAFWLTAIDGRSAADVAAELELDAQRSVRRQESCAQSVASGIC